MIGRREVEAAWGRIRTHVRRTPVIELPAGEFGVAGPLAMKLEQDRKSTRLNSSH